MSGRLSFGGDAADMVFRSTSVVDDLRPLSRRAPRERVIDSARRSEIAPASDRRRDLAGPILALSALLGVIEVNASHARRHCGSRKIRRVPTTAARQPTATENDPRQHPLSSDLGFCGRSPRQSTFLCQSQRRRSHPARTASRRLFGLQRSTLNDSLTFAR
jgi:hypothetical protein